ncbi:MAG: sugar ABC transporter permease [Chloroflexota bacterium]
MLKRLYLQQPKHTRDNIKGYLFVLPWLFSLIVFTAYPVVASFYFSMTDYDVMNPARWIGFENFETMFSKDPIYWKAVWNTTYFTLLSVPLQLLVALLLASMLNVGVKGIGIYRTAYYLPSLMPAVATALLWYVILDPRLGLLNNGLVALGLPKLGWLRSSDWSKPALILIAIWSGSGVPMLVFLAGLKDIPRSLLEAATIDGATAWHRFLHVTIPLLTPTIFFNLLIGIINSFQVFALAFVASSAGGGSSGSRTMGPLNSLLMYMIHLYRSGFRYFDMGYASAMAVMLFIVLIIITLALARSSSYWVYYEAGGRS